MKRTFHILAAAACIALALPVFAQRTAPVAMVTDVSGAVTIMRGGMPLTPTIAAEVAPPMKIEVKAGAKLVLIELASGDELQVTGPAAIEVKGTVIEVTPKEKLIRRNTNVGPVKVREGGIAQAAVVMRAAPPIQRLPLLSLAGTVTLEKRPTFRWAAVPGVGPYRFELADDRGTVLHEARTEATQLVLPEGIALEVGKPYTWEVSARRADGVRFSNFGDFTIAANDLGDRVKQLRPGATASTSEWAAYALWLDGQGLADESRAIWREVAKGRPDDPMLKALSGS